MNKLLIVLLAVCLVNVHAFVKRDAPETTPNPLEDLKNKAVKMAEDFAKTMGDVLSPENIKKTADEFSHKLQEITDNLNPQKKQQ